MPATVAWEYFDHFFCINLDRRPDRWREAQRELQRVGVQRYERFSALDRLGAEGGCASGCSASHRVLWRRIATGELGQRVFIFEDDFMAVTRAELLRVGYTPDRREVVLYDSLKGETAEQRLSHLLPFIPETWDLLYLGGGYQAPPRSRVNSHVIRNFGMLTTHAYAITPRMATLVTEHLDTGYGVASEHDPNVNVGGPDTALCAMQREDVYSYTVSPRLFIQRPTSMSDLNPQPLGFPWDQIDSTHEAMV